jgi:multisubunit Na+/H+ antiporter MnhC subunit
MHVLIVTAAVIGTLFLLFACALLWAINESEKKHKWDYKRALHYTLVTRREIMAQMESENK